MKNFISATMREPDIFSVREIYIKAWESLKRHSIKAAFVGLVLIGLYFSQFIVASVLFAVSAPVMVVTGVSVGIFLLQIYFSAVGINLLIHVGRDKDFLMSRLFQIKPRTLLSYAVVVLCLTVMTLVGFLLFIIPGIYVAFIYFFACFLVIDKNLGPLAALKASKKLFKSHLFNLFQYASVSFGFLYLLIMPVYFLLFARALVGLVAYQFVDSAILNIVLSIPIIILACVSCIVYLVFVFMVWFGAGHIYHKIASRN
ncbi:MAG: hypothetical protein QG626_258 [Patescibacteria group bacterium]|jgi:hypothetical protein|nr:hypothetical protein [Patescibacteria group bacterium]MDQ5952131.1 hypothetical protein [Patescibacteria group bacterium]